MLYQVQVNLVL